MSGQRITVNGVAFNAELRATSRAHDEQAAPTLVLLHGFTGSAAGWGAHLDAFASAGLRVVALDMLGHGESDVPADPRRYAIEHCHDDILAALTALGVAPGEATLLGYSMGGRIALYTAARSPGYFRRLILENASPGLASAEERAARRASDAALADRIEREGVPAFVDYWEGIPLFASQRALPPERQRALRVQRLRNSPLGLANSLRGVGTGSQPALGDQLSAISLPTLVIAGALDVKYCAIAREMAAALPHAQLAIVPGAGHAVHFERPAEFDALVTAFCCAGV